ncbi:Uncharacterised protein [Mycobacterium tuberculosis]|nr:Uncharacterised protein [Mycobacterium tuberculosis]
MIARQRSVQGRCLGQRLVDGGQRGIDHFAVELDQIGHLGTAPHLPVLAGTPRAGWQFDRVADESVGDRIAQGAHPDTGGG